LKGGIAIMERELLLRNIMALDFTLIDLNLYLNTHPRDMKALSLFRQNVIKARQLRMQFERLYGPLCITNYEPTTYWKWIDSPWPWEKCD
jgi:spore coat protein JB